MRLHDLTVSIWCIGNGAMGLASMEANASLISAFAVLLSSLAGFAYTMCRVWHIYKHIKAGTDLDDPEQFKPAKPPVHHKQRSVRDD